MADAHRDARLDLARRLAGRIRARATAVAVVGSTATGLCDRWSDLELLAVWPTPPTPEERQAIADALDAEVTRRFTRDERWFGVDNLKIGGFGVDLIHRTEAGLDADVRAATTAEPDLAIQEVLANLQAAINLRGEVDAWRVPMPRPAAVHTVEALVRFVPRAGSLLAAHRGDRLRVQQRRAEALRTVCIGWHAAHVTWFPGNKALVARTATLPGIPDGWADQVRALLDDDSPAGATALYARVAADLDAIAAALPEADLARVRQRLLTGDRTAWPPNRLADVGE